MEIDESKKYSVSFRAINDISIKVYTENNVLTLGSEVDFDIKSNRNDSLNYFSTSVIGGIISCILTQSKKDKIELEDVEGRIRTTISNPLTLLGVRGYDSVPQIISCDIVLYYYCEKDISEEFMMKYVEKSLMYNTLKDTIEFNFRFEPQL